MKNNNTQPILADMHYDGVRFDTRIIEAMRAQNAPKANALENGKEEA